MQPPFFNYEQLTLPEAVEIQNHLREKLDLRPFGRKIHTIAGADVSLNRFDEIIYAGIVVLRYDTMQPVACSLVKDRTSFPYVPGFLAFREVPALLKAWQQLPDQPDVVMVDGNGIMHPRQMGIASHFGILAGIPTLGCAKKKLYGSYRDPGPAKGDISPVTDRTRTLAYALRSKTRVKPVFVSPGNGMSLDDSLNITLRCIGSCRLPEPTRKAHEFVNRFRTGQIPEGYHVLQNPELF